MLREGYVFRGKKPSVMRCCVPDAARWCREEVRRRAAEDARRAALQPPAKPAAPAPKQAKEADRAAAAKDKERTRDWILQYAEGESDSEEGGDAVSGAFLPPFFSDACIISALAAESAG